MQQRPDTKSTELGGIANLALMAPVKRGFIPGADTVSYARRLELLFKTLNAIRLGSRESSRYPSPFPDALGRFGILHSFRYALIPPEIGSDGEAKDDPSKVGVYRVYLNVTFDGGWEPYLRVIYRDLGPLLDTIFNNCDDYTDSSLHTFDQYIGWVRRQEIPAGILYTDSPRSVQDQRYLEAVEAIVWQTPDPAAARQAIAALALKPPPDTPESLERFEAAPFEVKAEVVGNNLRALKGLYDLRAVYPDNATRDETCLLRFAQGALPEFRALLPKLVANAPASLQPILAAARAPIDWLCSASPATSPGTKWPDPPVQLVESQIQAGILSPFDGVTHGCLLLLAVTDAKKARAWLGGVPADTQARCKGDPAVDLHWNIAFSPQGLRKLGPATVLDEFPQEFIDGMEARAGLLGDIRSNHPEHWRRPRYKNREIDLGSVHVVVQYRLVSKTDLDRQLHPYLEGLAELAADGDNGLRLLSTEVMRSYPDAANITTEHFGFQDGFSQPGLAKADDRAAPAFKDSVEPGELFMGHPNDRQDKRFPRRQNPLMDNGSFLVIRKLRQHVSRWRSVLRAAARAHDPLFDILDALQQREVEDTIASMMVGRRPDGTLVLDVGLGKTNNFNYDIDPRGSRCPFQSHMRRTNPRALVAEKRQVPRLVRRGMSYGPKWPTDPDAERGLYFMAYCGSIAEQFEVIQRWIAGGNSSGILASHSDPMLGVPQKGQSRWFQWLGTDGTVVRIDLGDQPLTDLDWGMYLFAPSTTGLKALTAEPSETSAAPKKRDKQQPPVPTWEAYEPHSAAFEERKRAIQGRPRERDSFWQRVNEAGGKLQTAYGLLLTNTDEVLGVLNEAGPSSVCGYGRRFTETVGPGFLGMDRANGHDRLAEKSGINKAIVAITEVKAFAASQQVVHSLLAKAAPGALGSGQETSIDVVRLGEAAIAGLYKAWFGLPDGEHMLPGFSAEPIADLQRDKARCPRDFFFVARHNFGAHPSPTERDKGTARGQAIQRDIRAYLQATAPDALVGLSKDIYDAIGDSGKNMDEVAHTIGGVMLGFGPSVHLHYANVMREWVEASRPDSASIWDLQTALLEAEADGADPARRYAATAGVMRVELIRQMSRDPVPSVIWREAAGSMPSVRQPEPPKTVIGLHGMMDGPDAETLMFGGSRDPNDDYHTVHACPGQGMAIGVLMGVISTLLLAGTLRRSPSPSILTLVR